MNSNADDTSRSPGHPIKRATVVYGKRSNHSTVDGELQSFDRDCSLQAPTVSPQRPRPSSPSLHASDNERSHSTDAEDPFQFSFRHQLKALDEEFDHRDAQAFSTGSSPPRLALPVGPSPVKTPQSVSMGTPTLSFQMRHSRSPALFSPSSTSVHATSTQEQSPEPLLVRGRVRRLPKPVSSDSEAEAPGNSSSVSPVRHAITTPHSRSSPTPPTSSEAPMVSRKTREKTATRDVLPLVFDDGQGLAAELSTKSKERRRSEPFKTKAPTKKERREAAFESSRIAASRPVQVARTQEQKYSLATFFTGLRRDNIMIPTVGAELPSDPIERFSSPTNNSAQVPNPNSMFGAPTGLLRTSANVGSSNQPSSSKGTRDIPPLTGDSDDEMPSVTSIIQRKNGKRQTLHARKQLALEYADTREPFDINSEDDELLIVKDEMHAVAREEAAQRRLDKAHSSPVKNMATLRRINHPSIRPLVVSPSKISKQELDEHAKPSFTRTGKSKSQLTKQRLDHLMIAQHNERQLKSIKLHEEEWVKGGGRLLRDAGSDAPEPSLSQRLGAYAELGLKAVEIGNVDEDDESDGDYTPDAPGSASLEPMDAEVDEDDRESDGNMEISQIPQSRVDDDDDEDVRPSRRSKSGQRHARVIMGSDDEGEEHLRDKIPSVQRGSISSMESQTEDENDKENSAELMYDRSEDKENKAVVRHELSSSRTAFGSRLTEDGHEGDISLASATDFNDATNPSKGDVRSPLKDISKDEDDLFLSPSAHTPFTDRIVTISPPPNSMPTLSLGSPPILRSERISRIKCLSLSPENDEDVPSGLRPSQPSFLERLRSQVSPEPSLAPIHSLPIGGFSQLFSAEDQTLTKPVEGAENNGLTLTLDVGLKPALEVGATLRRKAESIFEKEQEYVVAAAAQPEDRVAECLYVNDYGFLTQTRPEGSSPQVYRMTPSQASKFIGTQVYPTQTQPPARSPLRTLSFTVSQELSPEPTQLRRLRKRSASPLEQKSHGHSSNPVAKLNAFDILGKAPKLLSKAQEKPGKSEFVAVEAEESDEDDMFGFGGPKKGDEEDEDDNEQDKVVEGLVDDTVMDAETEAADLVLEKHREHADEDDQRLQKLHQDAVEGKFRMKRRDRGFMGPEDYSDEDDDDEARLIRQRICKKRRIEGDSLEALGQNEETRAFYNTYHQDLIDEDDEFGHLREDSVIPADVNDTVGEPEEQETVSVDEIRQRVRKIANDDSEVGLLDPEDTSWIDGPMMIDDDAICVKVVNHRRGKSAARPNVGRMDFDAEPGRHVENDQERKQLACWAKYQTRQCGTGRSGNSAAVTGHTKIKTGGGSLSSKQPRNAAVVNNIRKLKTPSLLSMVPIRKIV